MPNNKVHIHILPQPTETSCGPTCLQAVYTHLGNPQPLEKIMQEIKSLEEGGTLAVILAQHALKSGFKTTIYTYNLRVFDPSWFYPHLLDYKSMENKVRQRAKERKEKKLVLACHEYANYLALGGVIKMFDLTHHLIRTHLKKGIPILTGLSSTYLYRTARASLQGTQYLPDDVAGDPEGHFVILEYYDQENKTVTVVDPYDKNPYSVELRYSIDLDRLINSILLGVLTYDANLLIIEK